MSEKIPIGLHNSDLFLKPEFTETDQEELNLDTFQNSILKKKGPSLGENNHVQPLYTSDLLPRLQLEVKKRRLESASQRFRNRIDKVKDDSLCKTYNKNKVFVQFCTSLGAYRLQFPLKYELGSGFLFDDKAQLESHNKYYLRSKSRFLTDAERLISNQTNISQNYKKGFALQKPRFLYKQSFAPALLSSRSSKHTSAPLDLEFVNSAQTENQEKPCYSVYNERSLSDKSKVLLKALPSLIRSGISREFLLVAINLILLSILAVVQRNNYGLTKSLTKNEVFCTSTLKKPIKKAEPFLNRFFNQPLTGDVKKNKVFFNNRVFVRQNVKQSSWQYLNLIKPGYLSFVLQNKGFTVPWQDQKQEKFVGVFLGELNLNSSVTDDADISSKYKQIKAVDGEEIAFLFPLQSVEPERDSDQVSDTVFPFTKKSLNKGSVSKSIGEKSPFFWMESRKPFLPFDCDNYVCYKWPYKNSVIKKNKVFWNVTGKRLDLCKTSLKQPASVLRSAKVVDCVIKPWYCMKAYNTSNDKIVATRAAQEKVDNGTCYKNPKIQGFQYYMPYYTSQERIFAESDTIPSKRGSISSQTVKNESSKPNSGRESTTTESILKKFFYKYGFFVISPLNVNNSCIPGDYINLALYRNVDTPYFEPSVDQRVAPVLPNPDSATKHTFNQACCLQSKQRPLFAKQTTNKNIFFIKGDFTKKLLLKTYKRETLKKALFPSTFAWSRYNLSQVKPNAFAQVKSSTSTFHFIPDSLVKNISVSGYKFPELKKKEIVYLFRQRAILDFYLYFNKSNKKEVFDKIYIKAPQRLLNQIATPFHTFQSYDLIDQVLSTQGSEPLNRVFTKIENKTESFQKLYDNQASKNLGMSSNLFNEPDLSVFNKATLCTDLKMQYTQINLGDIENIKEIFSRMGRDYEEYLRQPKDSLPALVISPSLEDDREIEEEGIQIFRKRDLIKNTRNARNTGGEVGEGKTFTENAFQENGNLNLHNTSFLRTQELNKSEKTESKNEIQNRQNLVKNALRQAQEEIDNIAKKEEKGGDKEKQVIPPLTRLEALYTIRNRERKREQAKDLTSSKSTTSYLRLRASKNPFNILSRFGLSKKKARFNDLVSDQSFALSSTKQPASVFKPVVKNKSFPFFEELLLYSDKPRNADFKGASKLRDFSVCTDRKHSFFGEMSLLPKKLTAQEQKQIFDQKANPLLKVNTKTMQEENRVSLDYVPSLSTSKSSSVHQSRLPDRSFDQRKIVNFDIIQYPKFQIGTRLLPGTISGLQNQALLKSLPSPIYFYKNLSQNKACQASAPKIRGTPLGSPVSHRVWQPKRMEPSTFRFSSRNQSTPVVPRISQKDWTNMIEWQLKKHFFEEDRRLLLLSLNKNKNLKIKRVNLYLPWISIKKAEDIGNSQTLVTTNPEQNLLLNKDVSGNEWPLTRLDLRTSNLHLTDVLPYKNDVFLNVGNKEVGSCKTSFCAEDRANTQLHRQTSSYWRLPVQQTSSIITWPVKKGQRPYFSQKERLRTVNKSQVKPPQKELGIGKKVSNSSVLFESVTAYSWLFVYTFVFVLMFKQLFNLIYKVGFKDFFIKFLNSDFGRTITSEEFRYSIQSLPLTESYMPKKRLQELLGLEKNQVQLLEVVWFLRNNCQGRNGPRGILLVGPPGVENVSVVQAIAGEAKVPIIVQSLEKIAQDNEPQRQLEQLYTRAHKQAPCILFLDQLDTIGARRDQLFTNKRDAHSLASSMTSIYDQKEYNVNTEVQNSVNSGNKLNVVLRLLTILDGITQSSGVVTVATAQDVTKLDPALLRPKRFDRRIYLSLPNRQDRVNLFKIQTQSIGCVKEMPWDYLSLQTENMSTADIKSAINYSLFRAVLKKSVHTVETLEYGIDCVKTLTNKRVDKR